MTNISRYMDVKLGRYPHIEVSRNKFLEMLIAKGETAEKAEEMANVSIALGTEVLIADKLVAIKPGLRDQEE